MNITFQILDCKYTIFLLQRKKKQIFFMSKSFFYFLLIPNNDRIRVKNHVTKLSNTLNINKKEIFIWKNKKMFIYL